MCKVKTLRPVRTDANTRSSCNRPRARVWFCEFLHIPFGVTRLCNKEKWGLRQSPRHEDPLNKAPKTADRVRDCRP
jgi:hypothetical protein